MKPGELSLCGLLLAAAPTFALAHVILQQQEAPAGARYDAVLTVGHSCAGSPTVAVRVMIPDEVLAVVPMPKEGWELEVRVEPYPEPIEISGETLTEGVREIKWSGGSMPEGEQGTFSFRGQLPDADPGTMIYFPVVQECVEGVNRWIETTTGGATNDHSDSPAPGVMLSGGE